MDDQRQIRIPKKAGIEGDTFFLLTLGSYHILIPVPSEKPELDIEGSISDLLKRAETEISEDVSKRWRRKEQEC
ncbi:MAG: hypothetical protein GF309_08070 [Candidatus Lokiarchaeota archaeon]|nr:hypothetical protein [Candidatus Lokiarchaeota archaeon]